MKNFNIMFESDNIIYVKIDENLINEYLVMVNDAEVQKAISHNTKKYTYEEEIEWVKENLENNATIFSMIEKGTGDYIGNIEIMNVIDGVGEMGIAITPNKQNKHYGQEAINAIIDYALNAMKLKNVDLNVYKTNPRAIHCYEKVGFIADGIRKTEDDIHMTYMQYKLIPYSNDKYDFSEGCEVMRIGLDMDDTICETNESFMKYQQIYLENNKLTEEKLWSEREHSTDFLINNLEVIFDNAKIKKDAIEVIKKLKNDGHKLYIITARTNTYIKDVKKVIEKYLANYGIVVDEIIIHAKDKVDACIDNKIDVMIDDNLYNCERLIDKDITVINYDERNVNIYFPNRVNNWNDLYKKIQGDEVK